jgi:hypothetical protein
MWEIPTMTAIADNKKRVTIRTARPGDRFDVQVAEDGKIVLTKLVKQSKEARLVKPAVYKGLLVIEGELDQDQLVREMHAERELQNARLLG